MFDEITITIDVNGKKFCTKRKIMRTIMSIASDTHMGVMMRELNTGIDKVRRSAEFYIEPTYNFRRTLSKLKLL